MVALMAAKKTAKKTYRRPDDKRDVFARLDVDVADRFKRLVEAVEPPTTQSKYIAMLIRQHVEQKERTGDV